MAYEDIDGNDVDGNGRAIPEAPIERADMTWEEIKKQATPRPWGIEPEEIDDHYKPAMIFGEFDSDAPKVICDLAARTASEANAELICLAVNALKPLIEALEEALNWAWDSHVDAAWVKQSEVALRLVKGE